MRKWSTELAAVQCLFNMGGLGMGVRVERQSRATVQPNNSCKPTEETIKSEGQATSPRLVNTNLPANHMGSSSRSSFLYSIDLDREYLLSTCKFPCCTNNLINHSRKTSLVGQLNQAGRS